MTKEEIQQMFKECNEERARQKVSYENAPTEAARYYIEIEIAFNNGQMNIIRKLLDEE